MSSYFLVFDIPHFRAYKDNTPILLLLPCGDTDWTGNTGKIAGDDWIQKEPPE
jgi:hypothetical protein